jgi:hypothetical protein
MKRHLTARIDKRRKLTTYDIYDYELRGLLEARFA